MDSAKLAEINSEMENRCLVWAETNHIEGWKKLIGGIDVVDDFAEEYVELLLQLCGADQIKLEHKLWGALQDAIRLYEFAAHYNLLKQKATAFVADCNAIMKDHGLCDDVWVYYTGLQNNALWQEKYYGDKEKYNDDYSFYYLQVCKLLMIHLSML